MQSSTTWQCSIVIAEVKWSWKGIVNFIMFILYIVSSCHRPPIALELQAKWEAMLLVQVAF